MCHTKLFINSRCKSAANTASDSDADARLAALQAKCSALEEECRALREECRRIRMEERRGAWKPNWKY